MAGELSLKTPLTGLVTLVPTNTATDKTITLPATTGTMVVQDATNTTTINNLAYTGTLTGGTGVVNIGSGQVYKDASGNVGIGTSSPLKRLHVNTSDPTTVSATNIMVQGGQGGYGAGISFGSVLSGGSTLLEMAKITADGEAAWNTTAANQDAGLRFFTTLNGSLAEKVRLTSDGNVGIGIIAPDVKLRIDVASPTRGIIQTNRGTGSTGSQFHFSQDGVADWVFGQPAGVNAFVFWSGRNIASDGSERMRITSGGDLAIGKQVASESYTTGSGFGFASPSNPFFSIVNLASSSNNACIYLNQRNTTATNSLIVFLTNNGSSQSSVGSIYHNGTNTTYATSSDYRLKNITGELTNSGTFIDALKPKVGTWKSNGSPFVGFLAHEFAEVSPSSVSGEKDAVDKNGNPEYQGMQASSSEVMANIIAELQSLRKRVAELENK